MLDRVTNRSRGFGFVHFNNKEDMDEAVEKMHETELDGRKISVNRAIPQDSIQPGTPAAAIGRRSDRCDQGTEAVLQVLGQLCRWRLQSHCTMPAGAQTADTTDTSATRREATNATRRAMRGGPTSAIQSTIVATTGAMAMGRCLTMHPQYITLLVCEARSSCSLTWGGSPTSAALLSFCMVNEGHDHVHFRMFLEGHPLSAGRTLTQIGMPMRTLTRGTLTMPATVPGTPMTAVASLTGEPPCMGLQSQTTAGVLCPVPSA